MSDRRCTRCKRPVAKHKGRCGTECTNTPLWLDPATQEYVEPPEVIDISTSENITTSENTTTSGSAITNANGENYQTPCAEEQVQERFAFTVTAASTASTISTESVRVVDAVNMVNMPNSRAAAHDDVNPVIEKQANTSESGTQSVAIGSNPVNRPENGASNHIPIPVVPRPALGRGMVPYPFRTIESQVGRNSNPLISSAHGVAYLQTTPSTQPIWSVNHTAPITTPIPTSSYTGHPHTGELASMAQHLSAIQQQLARLQHQSTTTQLTTANRFPVMATGAGIGANQFSQTSQFSSQQPQLASQHGLSTDQYFIPAMATHSYGAPPADQGQAAQYIVVPPPPAPQPPVPATVPGLASIDTLGDISRFSTIEGLSDRTLRSALRGMYIDIQEFLGVSIFEDSTDLQPVIDNTTGVVTYKYKRPQKKIANYVTWVEAFMAYERTMVQAHGIYAYNSMADYKLFILDCDRKFHWPAVYNLDVKHRQSLSGRSIVFITIDPTLVASCLDSSAVKSQSRCQKCKGPAHPPGECQTQSVQYGNTVRHRSASRGKQQQNEICNNFNCTACTYEGCRRMHKCLGCKGSLPFKVCIIKGPCANTNNQSSK